MGEIKLRDYQLECLQAIENKQDSGITRQMVVLPTGAGKTVIFSELIKDRNLKTLVIAHRIELLEQAQDKLKTSAPEMSVGIFCGDEKCHDKQVTIASIQSASKPKALEILKNEGYELLIIDEAHHSAADTYVKLIQELGFHEDNPKKLLVGFTATPKRGDKLKLNHLFQEVVYSLKIKQLVEDGYLVYPKGIHVKLGVDLSEVQKKLGDFKKASLRDIMNSEIARFIVISAIKEFAKERQGIVFSVDIDHSKKLRDDIIAAGFICETVHSKMPLDKRRSILKDFSNGKIQFVTNPMILTEGFDCPIADCMINAAPTMNRSLYIQKAGRVLRLHPDKQDALLIDFGNGGDKHELCTAETLSGLDTKMEYVTHADQLFSNDDTMKKAQELNVEMNPNASAYNPLGENRFDQSPKEAKLFDPLFWTEGHNRITEKQLDFLEDLMHATNTKILSGGRIEDMSSKHAVKCIGYLKEKKEYLDQKTPITKKQHHYINYNIGEDILKKLGVTSTTDLTKKRASMVIGYFKKMENYSKNSYGY